MIVGEAELRAESLVRDAEERRSKLAREISELQHLRQRVEVDLRRTLEGYGHLLEAYSGPKKPERDL